MRLAEALQQYIVVFQKDPIQIVSARCLLKMFIFIWSLWDNNQNGTVHLENHLEIKAPNPSQMEYSYLRVELVLV